MPLDADIHSQQNTTPRIESPGEPANIGYWTEPSAWLSYKFQLQKAGTFDVILETAAIADGSRLRVRVGDERLRLRLPNTGDFGKYTETTAGRVTLSRARRLRLGSAAARARLAAGESAVGEAGSGGVIPVEGGANCES